jgi:phage protein D
VLLAIGRPELIPQTLVVLQGFKDVIDDTPRLVVKLTPTLGDNGLTTRMELETRSPSHLAAISKPIYNAAHVQQREASMNR